MYGEAFHRLLKHIYMKETCNKWIDKCVHVLIKLEGDKAFERLIKLEKDKVTGILSVIHKYHLESQKLSSSLISTVNNNSGIGTVAAVAAALFASFRRPKVIFTCRHLYYIIMSHLKPCAKNAYNSLL